MNSHPAAPVQRRAAGRARGRPTASASGVPAHLPPAMSTSLTVLPLFPPTIPGRMCTRGVLLAGGGLCCGRYAPRACVPSRRRCDAQTKNSAFVFIKPHAVTPKVEKLVSETLAAKGITILKEGKIASEEIDSKKLIDQHYYAIASKATILKPNELNVPADKFKAQFGLDWQTALDEGKVFNAMDACEKLGLDADGLDKEWAKCKKAGKMIKFGGGFYCGLLEIEGKEPIYAFNGFFMSMRSKFTAPGLNIHYYVVEWDADQCPWADFRGKVLGPTDPAEAPADSLRGIINADWEALGLTSAPNVGDNGVHASASPFEGLAERLNWVGAKLEEDGFGKELLRLGVPEKYIRDGTVDPQVMCEDGSKGSLFDQLEDLDSEACAQKLLKLSSL